MCHVCEAGGMDRHMEETARLVAKYGVAMTGVFDPKEEYPNYTYTVGLTAKGLPELLFVGALPHQYEARLLNGLAQHLLNGDFVPTEGAEFFDAALTGVPVRFHVVPVQSEQDPYPGDAMRLYGEVVQVVQVLLPDKHGRYPGHPKFNLSKFRGAAGRGWTRKRFPLV